MPPHSLLDDDVTLRPPNKLINPGTVKLPRHKPLPPPLVGPFLPLGGNYADILAYFVERGRPTYQFTGMPVTKALVAIELWAPVAVALVPFVYLFLDNSIASQSWYYISAYVWNGGTPYANAGAVSGSPGPMTLISNDLTLPPNEGIMLGVIPTSQGCTVANSNPPYTYPGLTNPMLTQVSFGSAPGLEPSWWY